MKISQNNSEETNIQTEPKLRNINEEKEIIETAKPDGADARLKLLVAALGVLVIILAIKGAFTKSSLQSQIEEQNKLLTTAQAEALVYGITEDEDDDLVLPVIDMTMPSNISDSESESIEERNAELLSSFATELLTWKGKSGYDKVRQAMINDWGFAENSKLLTTFMPVLEEELNANMSLSTYSMFVLTNDGKNMSYFLICTVRNTINGTSATGTVGIQVTINEDGTLSNVTAQTLS